MKKLLLLLGFIFLCNTVSARVFLGFPTGALVTGNGVGVFNSVHFGSYTLSPHFGVRGVLETDALFAPIPTYQGSVDAMLTTGEASTFYAGAGVGIVTLLGDVAAYANPFIGVDLDSGSALSWFIEVNPRVYIGSGGVLPTVVFRSGLNFQLGEPSTPRAARPVAVPPQKIVSSTPQSIYVNGRYTDEDGNVWLEPVEFSGNGSVQTSSVRSANSGNRFLERVRRAVRVGGRGLCGH